MTMNNQGPLITVVTVALNSVNSIGKSIESMSVQTFKRTEYLVVDGGSTDGTLELVMNHRPCVSAWLSEPDRGISDAFNKGIRMSQGQIVGLLNAGDWYEPDTLSLVAEAFHKNPEIDVFCGAIRFWEAGSATIVCNSTPDLIEKETSIYHPAVFIRKSSYAKYGGYDESYRYAMDYELLLRFKRLGARFSSLEKVLANMSLDGVSQAHWYAGLKEVKNARSRYFSHSNVVYSHTRAVAMNLIARGLKRFGLSNLYRMYWTARNERMIRMSREGVS